MNSWDIALHAGGRPLVAGIYSLQAVLYLILWTQPRYKLNWYKIDREFLIKKNETCEWKTEFQVFFFFRKCFDITFLLQNDKTVFRKKMFFIFWLSINRDGGTWIFHKKISPSYSNIYSHLLLACMQRLL